MMEHDPNSPQQQTAEFDAFAGSYQELLSDPIRGRFSADGDGFFHLRKRDLIREYFHRKGVATRNLSYLDLGCGKGELMGLLREDFAGTAGCDPSGGMLEAGTNNTGGLEKRVQTDPDRIPYESARFDFVTAVCVYHHVRPADRAALTAEVARVLRPGGVFAIIEHNPYNPVTRLIVSRAPVDVDAILLQPKETRQLLAGQRMSVDDERFFLYFPEKLYRSARAIEKALGRVPLGGQYATFGKLPASA